MGILFKKSKVALYACGVPVPVFGNIHAGHANCSNLTQDGEYPGNK